MNSAAALGPEPRGRRVRGRDGFLIVEALAALGLGALILVALLTLTGMLRLSADRAAARVETIEVSGRTIATIANEVREATRRRWAAEPESAVDRPFAIGARRSANGQTGGARQTAQQRQPQSEDGDGQSRPEGQGEGQGPELDPAQLKRPFVFSGGPDRLAFALSPVQATGLREDVLVAWQIDEAGAALRAEGPLPATATGVAAVSLGPVARVEPGPERLRFAYVARQPSGDEVVTDAWTETLKMPDAVRIDRLDPRTLVLIGSLRVPIMINGEPGCANPQKGFCSHAPAGGERGGAGRRPPADGQANERGQDR